MFISQLYCKVLQYCENELVKGFGILQRHVATCTRMEPYIRRLSLYFLYSLLDCQKMVLLQTVIFPMFRLYNYYKKERKLP